jgi:hypothetical protein
VSKSRHVTPYQVKAVWGGGVDAEAGSRARIVKKTSQGQTPDQLIVEDYV